MATVSIGPARNEASKYRRGGDRAHRLNDQVAWLLLILVAGSAVPLGGARPFLWALYAALAGAVSLYYAVQLERTNAAIPRLPLGLPTLLGFVVLCAFLLLQCLPVPALAALAGPVISSSGVVLTVPQLSLAPGNTVLMLVQMLSYGVVLGLVCVVGANRHRRLWLLDALFYVVVVHAGFALVALTQLGDLVLVFQKWAYQGVATGTFVNRNAFATYLAIGLVLGAGLTLDEIGYRLATDRLTRSKDRARPARSLALHLAGVIVVVAALLTTQSRMGVAAAALGTIVVAGPLVVALPVGKVWRFGALVGLVATVAALLLVYGQGFLERLGSVEASADVRFDLYRQVLEMIAARPWSGFGGAAFEAAYPLFHQLPVSPDLVWDRSHNTYLALWAELGIVVGSIPILLLIGYAARLIVSAASTTERLAQLCALGALAASGLHALVDFGLEIEANALLLLMVIGLGLAATVLPKSQAVVAGVRATS